MLNVGPCIYLNLNKNFHMKSMKSGIKVTPFTMMPSFKINRDAQIFFPAKTDSNSWKLKNRKIIIIIYIYTIALSGSGI